MLTYHQKTQILSRQGYNEDYENAVAPPIFQTSNFTFETQSKHRYIYTSSGNPTFSIVEEKIAAVESGRAAKLFSSGMAAIHSVILSNLKSGDYIIVHENVYGGAVSLFKNLKNLGINVTFIAGGAKEIKAALRPETKMLYIESPSSKLFQILDLKAIGKIGNDQEILRVIDNTWATPMFQNPISFGFHYVIHSATKYLGGHSDLIGGVVIGSKKAIRRLSNLGAAMDPHQAWLLNRSLITLPMRMKYFMENTSEIAAFLEEHPKVHRVFYPGLPSHPDYELGKRQMSGYSSLFSFVTKGDYEQSLQVIKEFKLIKHAWSYGGHVSLAEHYGKYYRNYLDMLGYPPTLIRLHVGFEDPDEIKADLDNALRVII